MSTSPTKSRAPSPPARAPSSSSTPPRASRRRHWPTSTSRSSTTTRSSRHQQGRLPSADPDKVRKEIEDIVGLPADDAVLTSAKTGIGIDEVLEAIVTRIPPPTGDRDAPLKAMLVDSWYDPYLGVVILIRVVDGAIRKGQMVKFMIGGTQHLVDRVGAFRPKIEQLPELGPGEIGFITAQIKDISETRVGDTITDVRRPALEALPGFKEVQPVVFCGLFPVDAADFEKLRESISKLRLNDASFSFEMETSAALGLRLPLRLPRAPPPRDHPGAPHPRI
jgi:GTP-binding protein LepA